MGVMLMPDDSGSVTNSDFDQVKSFVKQLANDESIKDQMDKENVQFGMATFSECARWMDQKGEDCDANTPSLKYVHNSFSMKKILNDYQRMESITDMIKALEFVNNQMMEYSRASSDKVLMFMTDGKSQGSDYQKQDLATIRRLSNQLKEAGVRIYVIAVGDSVDQDELETISSSECKVSEKTVKSLLSKSMISMGWMVLSVNWLVKFVSINIGWQPFLFWLPFCLSLSRFCWTGEKPKGLKKTL